MADNDKTSAAIYIDMPTYHALKAQAELRLLNIGMLGSRLIERALKDLVPVEDAMQMSGEE